MQSRAEKERLRIRVFFQFRNCERLKIYEKKNSSNSMSFHPFEMEFLSKFASDIRMIVLQSQLFVFTCKNFSVRNLFLPNVIGRCSAVGKSIEI